MLWKGFEKLGAIEELLRRARLPVCCSSAIIPTFCWAIFWDTWAKKKTKLATPTVKMWAPFSVLSQSRRTRSKRRFRPKLRMLTVQFGKDCLIRGVIEDIVDEILIRETFVESKTLFLKPFNTPRRFAFIQGNVEIFNEACHILVDRGFRKKSTCKTTAMGGGDRANFSWMSK